MARFGLNYFMVAALMAAPTHLEVGEEEISAQVQAVFRLTPGAFCLGAIYKH